MSERATPDLTDTAAGLVERASRVLTARHYSRKTKKVYLYWIGKFLKDHPGQDPYCLREQQVNMFLSRMAVELNVASSTQNQASAALKFFYKFAVGEPLESMELVRAKGPRRVVTALTPEEVALVLSRMTGTPKMVCMLLFGSGLRIGEALNLRVKDIDFRRCEITVREGKGTKDRITVLPKVLIDPIQEHLKHVQHQHLKDLQAGLGQVPMPYALARKYPNADIEWMWQWVFPATSHYVDQKTGVRHRHHLHESVVQKAVRAAALEAGVNKHVTPHVLRHSFASQMASGLCDLRTLQALLGHEDIRTTQRYLHVLTSGGHGVKSPLDGLILPEGVEPKSEVREDGHDT